MAGSCPEVPKVKDERKASVVSGGHTTHGSASPFSPVPSVQWGSWVVVPIENTREENVG